MADFISMDFLELRGAEARIKKWKMFAHSETRTHDPWIVKQLPLPLGHETRYAINKLKHKHVSLQKTWVVFSNPLSNPLQKPIYSVYRHERELHVSHVTCLLL